MNIVSETSDISDWGAEAERGRPIPWLERLNDIVGMLVEFPAALLVAAEVVVLLMGVIWRYVLHTPLVWSDELASILFLWLAMLGSIVALRRGEHMRMTALVGKLPRHLRAFIDLIAIAAALAFLLLVVRPAYEFAEDEMFVTTPSLEITSSWRAAALPIGIGLMIVVGFLQIFRFGRFQSSILALGAVAAVAAITAQLGPYLHGLGNWNLLIFFVLGVGSMVLLGVPIAFSFGLATFAYLALTTSTPTVVVVGRMDEGMSELLLLAVPLFVLLGLLIEMTGMAKALIDFMASLLAHVKGGLSYVLLGAMYLVSGISGSKVADMAAVAPVLFPEMKRRGSKPGELVALLASAGAMSETIPPSIVLLTVGSVTGISMAALFTGGLVPAAIAAAALVFVVFLRSKGDNVTGVERATRNQIFRLFLIAL